MHIILTSLKFVFEMANMLRKEKILFGRNLFTFTLEIGTLRLNYRNIWYGSTATRGNYTLGLTASSREWITEPW